MTDHYLKVLINHVYNKTSRGWFQSGDYRYTFWPTFGLGRWRV